MNKFVKGIAVAGLATAMSQGAIAACGDVTIAEMNWASAEFMANVDKIILEEGYGCTVELVPGATLTTFASMDTKGVPDIAPELWTQSVEAPLKAAIAAGSLHSRNCKVWLAAADISCPATIPPSCTLVTSTAFLSCWW